MSDYRREREHQPRHPMSAFKIRLLLAAAIVVFSVLGYFSNTDVNPITGKAQRVGGMTPEQEIVLGLQAVEQMAVQFDGFSRDMKAAMMVEEMGQSLVKKLLIRLEERNQTLPYRFHFHLLADQQTINAFALPGGQIFITEALYERLTHPGQLAGVLAHEIGHVLERHSAQQMAQGQLFAGISSAAGVAAGDVSGEKAARMVTGLVGMRYGRHHELESDRWGVELMVLAGYDPVHLLELMDILESFSGGGRQPEFLSTHPLPANRKDYIERVVGEVFPNGKPAGLQ
ncbi:MAG: M48 family metallopeptidase [Pirellulaceae bacterium]